MANVVEIVIQGINKSKQALTAPIKDLKDLKTAAAALGPSIAVGASAAAIALGAMAKKSIDNADNIAKMSQKVGVSTEALSTLGYAASLSGVDIDGLQKGLQKMSSSVIDAQHGLLTAKQAFSDVGISIKNADGSMKSADQILLEVSDKFKNMPDGVNKTGMAMKLFGKAGAELIPLLNEGSDGIAKMQTEARNLGLEISGKTAKAAELFNDNMERMTSATMGAVNSIVNDLLPGINQMTSSFVDGAKGPSTFGSSLDALINIFKFLGKIGLSALNEINTKFEILGTWLGGIGATMFQLVTGNFAEAKSAFAQTFKDIGTISVTAKDNLKAIWTGEETGPKPPNPDEHAQKNAEIVNQAAEVKRTFDTMEFERLQTVKQASLDEVQAKLNAFNQTRMLTAAEGAEYQKLFARKVELQKQASDNAKKLAELESSQRIGIATNLAEAVGALAAEGSAAAKASAIAISTINAYQSITKTLADGGAFAIPLAISTGVLALAQVAKISGVAFEGGGPIPGNSPSGDTTLFHGNSGEWVFNKAQLNNLAVQLDQSSQSVAVTVMLEGQTLLDFTGRASRDGRLTIDARALG